MSRIWSRIYTIYTISKIGAEDRSSGAPDPERRMERRTLSWPVARGPVPRDRSTHAKTERQPTPFSVPIEAWRGTGPRPTVNNTLFLTVARGPVPRATGQDEKNAGDKPPRYEEEQRAITPAASPHQTLSRHDSPARRDPANDASATSPAAHLTKLPRSDNNTRHPASPTYP